jgi:hypothetical protein
MLDACSQLPATAEVLMAVHTPCWGAYDFLIATQAPPVPCCSCHPHTRRTLMLSPLLLRISMPKYTAPQPVASGRMLLPPHSMLRHTMQSTHTKYKSGQPPTLRHSRVGLVAESD